MISRPILLVEDDENDVFFFKMAAKKAGLDQRLVVVDDGRKATAYLENEVAEELPCLIFLDLKLPYTSGVEVLEWMREQSRLQAIVTVILTSSEAERDMRDCYNAGANSYLVKPGNPDHLVGLLKLVDQYWLKSNRLPPVEGEALLSEKGEALGIGTD